MSDSKAETPVVHPDGQAHARYLIPLWSWLAILTVSIALFFHASSQGSPILIEFGVTIDGEMKYGRAGLWGVLFLAPCLLAFYSLTLAWMRRNYLEKPNVRGWERWPAPEFWGLPVSDSVARYLRVGVWVLLFLLPMISLVHLAKKHFQTEFYQSCAELADTELAACKTLDPTSLLLSDPALPANKKNAYRPFAGQKSLWQSLRAHLSLRHLAAPSYSDHSFYFAKPSADTYFPGLQGWLYVLAITAVFWLWLRIMLSVGFARMVLAAPLTTLRRLLLLRLRSLAQAASAPTISLPPPMLRIGVIGHRDLGARAGHVQAQLLQVIGKCKCDGYGVRVVCGMAAGADRLAMTEVLKQLTPADANYRKDLELLALLPGACAGFRDHSSVNDKSAFDTQMQRIRENQSARVALLELPGVLARYSDPQLANRALSKSAWDALKAQEQQRDAPNRALRIAAHRYKSDVLLRQCEFLIAVMKLSDSGKPGGTRECVEAALALNTPVLVIDIDSDTMALVTRVDQLHTGALPRHQGLEEFAKLIGGEELLTVDPNGMPTQLGYLSRVYRVEPAPKTNRLAIWWQYFEAWFGNERGPKPSAERLEEHVKKQADKPAQATPPSNAESAPFLLASVRRRIADDQGAIMAGYRGAFVLAYGLGLVAVTLALSIAALLVLIPISKPLLITVAALTLLKLTVVSSISWIIHATGPKASHGHAQAAKPGEKSPPGPTIADIAVAMRYVAERLRIMPAMAKLGGARMDLLHQSHRMGEPARVAEDLCRRIPLSQIVEQFDRDPNAKHALKELTKLQQSQHDYNTSSNAKWQRTHDRLETIVNGASRWVIRVIFLDLIVIGLKFAIELHWLVHFPGHEALKPIGMILVLTTAHYCLHSWRLLMR